MHEASLYEENSFITLTYAPKHLPEGGTLVPRHFQLFMKRLRKAIRPKKVRFYHCGEYGADVGRPHYHALLFGYEFPDRKAWREIRGNPVYTSVMLADVWGKGFCSIGSVTLQSAAYVARYILKKQTGDPAKAHYEKISKETGEITARIPEYTTMSRRPGIAAGWFEKFAADVYPDDFVVMGGQKYKTPRYYDKLVKATKGGDFLDAIKAQRVLEGERRKVDSSPSRLVVREKVLESKIKLLKREFEDENGDI